ncbi:ATP-binding cassette domain-containing protein [Natrialba asiatica]|uniref:ABC transporter ATPase n=1 Tax=Natrialba asiatica (strain ATCC 700177 / DSM 12278 / JCM 9576 / FERM P-10747 / NBRC 102637 / 172P1) TaxID=29540 RepID=M0APP6_NATA1|nr:ATP-binding cassette domain-containing protein [Natrialba asiatica]ELY99358.1 ABC transporter ATPase [Natrialba asiatica DSM 12278]
MTERASPTNAADRERNSSAGATSTVSTHNGAASVTGDRQRDRSARGTTDGTDPTDTATTAQTATETERERPLAIETTGLVKHFGETKAVDGIDLAIPAGGIYGLLGPNGAGKTTVIRMLATLLQPDAGTARVFGHDVATDGDAVRRRVSMTGQFASVDEDLTGRENLVLLARLLGYSRAQAAERTSELIDAFGLTEASTRQVKTYSGGMRRRLDIAASIVVTPDLLFLDEPTTGLDPRNRNQVWDIIRALVANGTTVLLTTQYLDEADQLADRIAVIDEGRIIAEGTPGELKASVGSGVLSVRLHDAERRDAARDVLASVLDAPVELESDPAALSARIEDPDRVTQALDALAESRIEVSEFTLGQPSLDEFFLEVTDRSTRSDADRDTPTGDGTRQEGAK